MGRGACRLGAQAAPQGGIQRSFRRLQLGGLGQARLKPFWKSLRASVVPAGQLRSFVVRGVDASESDVEPLGQLAGSLEELALSAYYINASGSAIHGSRLPRFPEFFCALTELRYL